MHVSSRTYIKTYCSIRQPADRSKNKRFCYQFYPSRRYGVTFISADIRDDQPGYRILGRLGFGKWRNYIVYVHVRKKKTRVKNSKCMYYGKIDVQ